MARSDWEEQLELEGNEKNLVGEGADKKLKELLDRAEPMIERLNNLYNQYKTGSEKLPPRRQTELLDQVMRTIQLMGKSKLVLRYRSETLNQKYVSFSERWKKIVRSVEAAGVVRKTKLR